MLVLLTLWLSLTLPAHATSIQPLDLRDILKMTNVVVIAQESKRDMIDKNGLVLTDPKAKTGPGLENTIRSHLVVKKVLYNKHKLKVPNKITIPHWQMWHMSNEYASSSPTQADQIYLLKTNKESFNFAYDASYSYDLKDQKEIMDILRKGPDSCLFEKVEFRMEELNADLATPKVGVANIPTAYLEQNKFRLQLVNNLYKIQLRSGGARDECSVKRNTSNATAWLLRNDGNKVLLQFTDSSPWKTLELVDLNSCKTLWSQSKINSFTVLEESLKMLTEDGEKNVSVKKENLNCRI